MLQVGEVLRQRLALTGQPAAVVCIRKPHWADAVRALDPMGEPVAVAEEDGQVSTIAPVSEVEFVYMGGLYAENRRCARLSGTPELGELFVIGHGPKLVVCAGNGAKVIPWPGTLEEFARQGVQPLSAAMRNEDFQFLFRRAESSQPNTHEK